MIYKYGDVQKSYYTKKHYPKFSSIFITINIRNVFLSLIIIIIGIIQFNKMRAHKDRQGWKESESEWSRIAHQRYDNVCEQFIYYYITFAKTTKKYINVILF